MDNNLQNTRQTPKARSNTNASANSTEKKKPKSFISFALNAARNVSKKKINNTDKRSIPTSGDNPLPVPQRRKVEQIKVDNTARDKAYHTFLKEIEPLLVEDNVNEINRLIDPYLNRYEQAEEEYLQGIIQFMKSNNAVNCLVSLANNAINNLSKKNDVEDLMYNNNNNNRESNTKKNHLKNLNTILSGIENTDSIKITEANKKTIKEKKLLSKAVEELLKAVFDFFLKRIVFTYEELNNADIIANRKNNQDYEVYREYLKDFLVKAQKNNNDNNNLQQNDFDTESIDYLREKADELKEIVVAGNENNEKRVMTDVKLKPLKMLSPKEAKKNATKIKINNLINKK